MLQIFTLALVSMPLGSVAKEIIGYYPSWQWYDRNKLARPQNLDFSKVTIVNFAFFQTDTLGNIYGTDSWADPNVLFGPQDWNPAADAEAKCNHDAPGRKTCNYHNLDEGLIALTHAAGSKIFPSIGGWTLSGNFPAVAASESARSHFADQCVELIKDYGFDGIDIDWEYPSAADTTNFNLFLQAVRDALDAHTLVTGQYYPLTAALSCGPTYISHIDVAYVNGVLDQLNLMTYDFHGSWDSVTGVNAPLYYQGWGEADFDVDSCVNNWEISGASRDAINIGLPFYGRSYSNADSLNEGHGGSDTLNWNVDDGTPQYFNIMDKMSQMVSVRDETTKTEYAYFAGGDNLGFVSYDDPQAICDKVEYAQNEKLNGFIIWEITGDVMPDLSTPLLDMVSQKLATPTMPCSGTGVTTKPTTTTTTTATTDTTSTSTTSSTSSSATETTSSTSASTSTTTSTSAPESTSSTSSSTSTSAATTQSGCTYTEAYVQSLLDAISALEGELADCTGSGSPGVECGSIAAYVEASGYTGGDQVTVGQHVYECKPAPYSGWCDGNALFYGPQSGSNWQDCWIDMGECP